MDVATETRRRLRGTKRVCKSCDGRFYDLARDPTVCPLCHSSLPVAAFMRPPEPTRGGAYGGWSRTPVAYKVLPVEEEAVAAPEEEVAEADTPAAEGDAILETEDEVESDVSDLLAPDDEARPDE